MSKPSLPPKVVTELNRQINQELAAEHSYLALSAWCADQNLRGFAAFFAEQAAEEQEHAGKIMSHLSDRRVLPELGAIPAPKREFASLLEAAQHTQAMEKANTRGIHSVYEAAQAAKDYPAQVLMHWFINEQVEEERWSTEMVERVQAAACAGSLMDLDRHIQRLLAKDEKGKKSQ
jgi:ferritin